MNYHCSHRLAKKGDLRCETSKFFQRKYSPTWSQRQRTLTPVSYSNCGKIDPPIRVSLIASDIQEQVIVFVPMLIVVCEDISVSTSLRINMPRDILCMTSYFLEETSTVCALPSPARRISRHVDLRCIKLFRAVAILTRPTSTWPRNICELRKASQYRFRDFGPPSACPDLQVTTSLGFKLQSANSSAS